MTKVVVSIVIVIAIVLGGLLSLRRNARLGQPSQEVIDRAKLREREIEAKERDEKFDS
jgi:hypothetical protein